MSHGVQALGAAGIAGNENQIAFGGASFAPLQEIRYVHGLVVLINAEKTDVQVITGIFKIVWIAAEEGDRLLRRKNQTHIGVTLVAIEMILSAVVERNHVAAQA